jgi:16S rRNA (cytosine967-C5)-methyltransferase
MPPAFNLSQDQTLQVLAHSALALVSVLSGQSLGDLKSFAPPYASPSQQGAIRDLTFRTLRSHARTRAFLTPFVQKVLPLPIEALLLVALCRLDEHPTESYRIVDQAVCSADFLMPPLKGLVNAILRNALRERDRLLAQCEKNPEAFWQHPLWWIQRVQTAYPNQWQAILAAGNSLPPMSIRPNRLKLTPETFKATLEGAGIQTEPHPPGALRLLEPIPTRLIPGFAQGHCSVQDIGAQWAAHLLAPKAGELILDACAAPGNKTAHLLEQAPIRIHAIEQSATRMLRLTENLGRLGLCAFKTDVADCRKIEKWWDKQPFDAILADVPCTASGVARRHPDIKWLRREADIGSMVQIQREILDALWTTLKPGGRLLYGTCSVFPEENDNQIQAFLARTPNAQRLSLQGRPFFQLLPSESHDGFFYAMILRREQTG